MRRASDRRERDERRDQLQGVSCLRMSGVGNADTSPRQRLFVADAELCGQLLVHFWALSFEVLEQIAATSNKT